MKKIIAVGMVVGLLCLSSCASSPEETTTVAITTNQTTETPTEATTQETEPVVPETLPMPDDPVLFEKGTIKLAYKSHEVVEDRDGNAALVVHFEYTNSGEKQMIPGAYFCAHGYQNGIEQEQGLPVFYKDGKDAISSARWSEYTPGTTIPYDFSFALADPTADFSIDINDNLFDESKGETQSMILKLS